MDSVFGWTVLSRDALRRAAKQLEGDVEGVRDEIGFLGLHQVYADRFFPGTSVQQTRLRYALFVPWIYERIHGRGVGRRITAELKEEELILARRLLRSGNQIGVIGGRVYPQASVIPPSLIYWTALTRWRIVRPLANGSLPGRSTIHRAIARPRTTSTRLHDDEHQMLEEGESIFASLPSPPKDWNNSSQPLDFGLTSSEAGHLRKCLMAVSRPGEPGTQSLLSRLVETGIAPTELWTQKIKVVAGHEEREALVRAQRASALAAIGIGAYAALVETIRERSDGVPTGRRHRGWLREVVDEYRADALALDLGDLLRDAPGLSRLLVDVLAATQNWVKGARPSPSKLEPLQSCFEMAEVRRKGGRARLAMTLAGRARRAEWDPVKHPLAGPLHYRWPTTRRLLLDLQAAG